MIRKAILLGLFISLTHSPAQVQQGRGMIEGEIRDLSGAPVPGASVYAYDYHDFRRRFNTTADSNGRFALRDLPPATYSVHAYKESDGYPDTFFSFFDVGNNKAYQLAQVYAGGTTAGVVLELGPKYAVLKLAVEDDNGNPVPAGLSFFRGNDPKPIFETSVGPNGEILVPPVPFRFVIESDGLQSWRSKLVSPQSDEVMHVAVRLKGHRSIGTIDGMVIDSDGTPVLGASVYVADASDQQRRVNTTADSEGRYAFRDVPPGVYTVHAYKESEGYPDTFLPFFAVGERKWKQVKLPLRGSANVVVQLGPKYPVLTLSIRNERGKPVAATLTFIRTDDPDHPYSVTVGPNARLLVPPVTFSFEIQAKGFRAWRSELISVSSGKMVSVTARLKAKSQR